MRTIRCRLAVSALLALVLGDALAMGADVVKIGAIFEDSKEVIFDGTQTWGWAANHAEAAAAAVARINSDDAILPGVEIQLVRIHVEALRAAAWMEGDCSRVRTVLLAAISRHGSKRALRSPSGQLSQSHCCGGCGVQQRHRDAKSLADRSQADVDDTCSGIFGHF